MRHDPHHCTWSPPAQIICRRGFFLPLRVLSKLFRRRFLESLQLAHRDDRLNSFVHMRRWQVSWVAVEDLVVNVVKELALTRAVRDAS